MSGSKHSQLVDGVVTLAGVGDVTPLVLVVLMVVLEVVFVEVELAVVNANDTLSEP